MITIQPSPINQKRTTSENASDLAEMFLSQDPAIIQRESENAPTVQKNELL